MAVAVRKLLTEKIEFNPPLAPSDRPHKAVKDQRPHFAKVTAKQPVDRSFREAFEQSKMLLAHTQPNSDLKLRDLAVRSVAKSLGGAAALKVTQPVPGGVGYGIFYTDGFKTAWGRGTSFAFDVICPTPPGGNVNTYLYLTATNRSALGVEAFVSYNDQNDTRFLVFDWARSDHWQTDCPFSALGNYLATRSVHGHRYQVLPIWNSTWRIGDDRWRNQALLYNRVRRGWDLVYQYDYSATDAQQKTGWIGSWGPIVETFQSLYTGTHPMGATRTQLISADSRGTWGSWSLLSSSNSIVRADNVGFTLVFLDPNYAFTVKS